MRVMHQPVQDRICRCRVLHQTVPLVYRELAYYDGAALSVAVFDYLQQVVTLRVAQRFQTQIVQYQHLRFLQLFKMLQPAAVNTPLRQHLQ